MISIRPNLRGLCPLTGQYFCWGVRRVTERQIRQSHVALALRQVVTTHVNGRIQDAKHDRRGIERARMGLLPEMAPARLVHRRSRRAAHHNQGLDS